MDLKQQPRRIMMGHVTIHGHLSGPWAIVGTRLGLGDGPAGMEEEAELDGPCKSWGQER